MCADGPAVDLDFYDLEFMGGLSVHNRLMYCRRKTNNLYDRGGLFFKNISLIMMLFGMQSRTMVLSPDFCPILRLDLDCRGMPMG